MISNLAFIVCQFLPDFFCFVLLLSVRFYPPFKCSFCLIILIFWLSLPLSLFVLVLAIFYYWLLILFIKLKYYNENLKTRHRCTTEENISLIATFFSAMTWPTNSPPPQAGRGGAPLVLEAGGHCATTLPPCCPRCAATPCRRQCRRPRKNLRAPPPIRISQNGRWTVLCCLPRSSGSNLFSSIREKTTGKIDW